MERVAEHDTGVFPVMNAAVTPAAKAFTLAAGLDQYCQLYSLKYRVVTPKATDGEQGNICSQNVQDPV